MDISSTRHLAWKVRLIIGAILLVFSFIGLVIGNLWSNGGWFYWRCMAPLFAILCLGLSWFLRRNNYSVSLVTVWHELLHWLGVLLAIYLVSVFAHTGLIGNIQENLFIMTLLALGIFLLGIYTEWSLAPIGIILGIFTAGAAFAQAYLYTVMLPVLFIGIGVLGLVIHLIHRKQGVPPANRP